MTEPDFARDGYMIARQAIPLGMLDEFEQAIVERAGSSSDWVTGLREIEAQDKGAFYRAMMEPGASAAGLAVAATLSHAVASVLKESTSRAQLLSRPLHHQRLVPALP